MNSKSDTIDAEIDEILGDSSGFWCGCYEGDMTDEFPRMKAEAKAKLKALLLRERLDERDYFKQVIDDVMSGNISPHFATALADDKIAEAQQELSRLSGEEGHE